MFISKLNSIFLNLIFVVFLSLLTSSLYAENNLNLTTEEKEWLKNNPIVTVGGSSLELEPDFIKMPDGTIDGLLPMFYKLVEQKLNIKFEYIDDKFSNIIEKTKKNEIDLVCALGESFTIKSGLLPVKLPMGVLVTAFANKNNTIDINKIQDFYGYRIAYWKDLKELEKLLKKHPQIQSIPVETSQDGFNSLLTNKIDFFIGFNQDHYFLTKNNIAEIEPIFVLEDLKIVSVAAIRSNAKPLVNILQKAFATITSEDIYKINIKWSWVPKPKDNNIQNNSRLDLNTSEQEYLTSKKNIKMCIDPNWMPFEKIDSNGNHIGITKDYYDYFSTIINKDFKLIKTKDWSQSMQFAKDRKCDILSLAMDSKDRGKYMNFTDSYIDLPTVIATKSDKLFIDDLSNLEHDTKVGYPKGYVHANYLKSRYPNLKIVEVSTAKDGLDLVANGKIFGMIENLATLSSFIRNDYYTVLKINSKLDINFKLAIGVRNDDKVLLSIMQKCVSSLDEKFKQNIFNKWAPVNYTQKVDFKYLWEILAIVFLFAIFMLYWINKLQKAKKELQLAKEEAQEATKAKSQFLANMSHEIRTPINGILGMLYIALEYEKDAKQISHLEKIDQSAKRLSVIIDDILDISKIEAGKLSLSKATFNIWEPLKTPFRTSNFYFF